MTQGCVIKEAGDFFPNALHLRGVENRIMFYLSQDFADFTFLNIITSPSLPLNED
jgi:hypothetical protein